MKSIFLLISFAGLAAAQCGSAGKLILNPLTHLFDCTGLAGAGAGTVTSVGLAGTSRQITVTGSSPITDSGSWTLSVPVGFLLVAANGTLPSVNIPDGTGPASPATGDLWAESGVFKTPNGMQFGIGSGIGGVAWSLQGTAPTLVANSWGWHSDTAAPAGGASYVYPTAAGTGFMLATNTGGRHAVTHIASTGSGNVVLAASPTITGHPTIEGVTATGATGTGKFVFDTAATIAGLTITGNALSGGATRTAPFRIGTIAGLPATCTVGDMYFASNATAGRNLYYCGATDTWTLQVVGAGGTGCVPGGSAGQFIVDDGAGACTSLTILTRTSNTIAGGAALTLDLSASTAFKAPGSFATGLLHVTTSTGAVVGGLLVDADVTASTLTPGKLTNASRDMVFGVTFDGGGSALTGGTTTARYITLPAACTIVAWDISVDAGTATFKTWRVASGTAIPTNSDSISTAGVAISSGTSVHSTTVTDWTDTTLDANDIIGLNLSAVATATLATFQVTCRK